MKNTVLGLSVPLKNEGENDLLANGENQTYCCVLGWAGNLNIRQMVILPEPDLDGEGGTWEVACNIKTFIDRRLLSQFET